jgi:uncharacterized protein YaeQ
MALKATIYKAQLQIADLDRHYYGEQALTLARHPSETDERMMVRLLVFALHAHERLVFGRGLSDPDEPDLWRKDLTGVIEEWIELGQPDEKAVLRACGRSAQVYVYGYNHAASPWWDTVAGKLARARNLTVRRLAVVGEGALADLAQRSMQLQCTIQDGQLWLSDAARSLQLECRAVRS